VSNTERIYSCQLMIFLFPSNPPPLSPLAPYRKEAVSFLGSSPRRLSEPSSLLTVVSKQAAINLE
jgi:hypothetical protein